MNELRLVKISDVDLQREQIHIRHGKGLKHRCVTLSKLLTDKLPQYLLKVKPGRYLFSVKARSTVFKHKYMEGFLTMLK